MKDVRHPMAQMLDLTWSAGFKTEKKGEGNFTHGKF
jgi:hypothetical protein